MPNYRVFLRGLSLCILCFVTASHAVTLAQSSSATFKKKFTGPPISIDLREADIHSVLRIFSDITHTNIVAHPDVQGTVKRLRLIEVPADQAFEIILRSYGLFAVDEGNVTIVYPLKTYLEDANRRSK